MGTRLSARKEDTDKQERTPKVVSVLVKDIDSLVFENKECTGIPDVDFVSSMV